MGTLIITLVTKSPDPPSIVLTESPMLNEHLSLAPSLLLITFAGLPQAESPALYYIMAHTKSYLEVHG